MARIAKFYEQLPKGAAAPIKPSGLLGRYKARYFRGDNASAAREFSLPFAPPLWAFSPLMAKYMEWMGCMQGWECTAMERTG
jgi:hypothetical protein